MNSFRANEILSNATFEDFIEITDRFSTYSCHIINCQGRDQLHADMFARNPSLPELKPTIGILESRITVIASRKVRSPPILIKKSMSCGKLL